MVSFCATVYKVDLQFLECCNVVLNGILILSGAVHFSYSDQLFHPLWYYQLRRHENKSILNWK